MIFFVTISLTFETIPRYTNRIENGRLTFDFSFILFHRYDRKKEKGNFFEKALQHLIIHSKRILREPVINHHLERNRFLSFSFRKRKR